MAYNLASTSDQSEIIVISKSAKPEPISADELDKYAFTIDE